MSINLDYMLEYQERATTAAPDPEPPAGNPYNAFTANARQHLYPHAGDVVQWDTSIGRASDPLSLYVNNLIQIQVAGIYWIALRAYGGDLAIRVDNEIQAVAYAEHSNSFRGSGVSFAVFLQALCNVTVTTEHSLTNVSDYSTFSIALIKKQDSGPFDMFTWSLEERGGLVGRSVEHQTRSEYRPGDHVSFPRGTAHTTQTTFHIYKDGTRLIVPQTGYYWVSLRIDHDNDFDVAVGLCQSPAHHGDGRCWMRAHGQQLPYNAASAVQLTAGDFLYLKVLTDHPGPFPLKSIFFSIVHVNAQVDCRSSRSDEFAVTREVSLVHGRKPFHINETVVTLVPFDNHRLQSVPLPTDLPPKMTDLGYDYFVQVPETGLYLVSLAPNPSRKGIVFLGLMAQRHESFDYNNGHWVIAEGVAGATEMALYMERGGYLAVILPYDGSTTVYFGAWTGISVIKVCA